MQAEYIVVLVTAKDAQEAQMLCGILVDQKLAACVNIVRGVKSFFWWEGKVDCEDECLLIIKSRSNQLQRIIDQVKCHHSYSVPEVIALPIIGGNADYLQWINDSIAKGEK